MLKWKILPVKIYRFLIRKKVKYHLITTSKDAKALAEKLANKFFLYLIPKQTDLIVLH